MKIAMFYHSVLSDWNEGNAHFTRGVAVELASRGHDVVVYEARDSWSAHNLASMYGHDALSEVYSVYPTLQVQQYEVATFDAEQCLGGTDLVLAHEWTEPVVLEQLFEYRQRSVGLRLLYHDTHHRAMTEPHAVASLGLSRCDGVLAFGNSLRDLYLEAGWASRAWTWREAADTRVFRPLYADGYEGDLVWVGNWGNEERVDQLEEFFIEPVRSLGLKARVYGVRYTEAALASLSNAGIEYAGWLPNYQVPEVFARFKITIHVPRRAYTTGLPGIPNIRPFEALACGIPLVTAPWIDTDHLFDKGRDFLMASDGVEMSRYLATLLGDQDLAKSLIVHGLHTIHTKHTCAHRVDELLAIYHALQ